MSSGWGSIMGAAAVSALNRRGKSIVNDHIADALTYGSAVHDMWGKTFNADPESVKLKCPSPMKLGGILKTWMVLNNVALDYEHWNNISYELDVCDGLALFIIKQGHATTLASNGKTVCNINISLIVVTRDDGLFDDETVVIAGGGRNSTEDIYSRLLRSATELTNNLINSVSRGDVRLDDVKLAKLKHWREGLRLMPKE